MDRMENFCCIFSYPIHPYTQTTSKVGNLTRRRPEVEPGAAGAEAAQLE